MISWESREFTRKLKRDRIAPLAHKIIESKGLILHLCEPMRRSITYAAT